MDNLTKSALGVTIAVVLGGFGFAFVKMGQDHERETAALQQQILSDQKKREDDKTAEMERKLEEAQASQRATEAQVAAQLEALRSQMAETTRTAAEERRIMEEERLALSETIADKVRKEEEIIGGTMTELQIKIREAASIGKVLQVHDELGFVVVDAGSSNGIQPEQRYNIRRDMFLVGELVISTVEDESHSVANIVPGSTQPGLSIRPGDEIIGQIY